MLSSSTHLIHVVMDSMFFEHIGEKNKKFSIVMISIAVVQTLIIQFGGKVFSTVQWTFNIYRCSSYRGLIIPADLIRKALTKNK